MALISLAAKAIEWANTMFDGVKRVLAIGAHPDDIELGCLGTLCLLRKLGAQIHAVTLSGCYEDGWGTRRAEEGIAALEGFVDSVEVLQFTHDQLTPNQRTVKTLSEIVRRTDPCLVLTHSRWDTHQDHRAVEQITLAACRRRPVTLMGYHAISSTPDFPVNVVVDITAVFDRKLEAVRAHTSQADQDYMQESWLRRWHHQKAATATGLGLVELFHLYSSFVRASYED
jgi:LmbE family N-acetylglucosaminyl deacetylase